MGKTKTKFRSVGDSPKPPITIRSTNPKILDDNIAKLEKAIQAGDVSANPSGTAEETLLSTIGIDGKKYELGPSAENTSYDNTDSGLTATETQSAIDELAELVNRGSVTATADGVKTYAEVVASLYALADTTKITGNSYITDGNVNLHLALVNDGVFIFSSFAEITTYAMAYSIGLGELSTNCFVNSFKAETAGNTFTSYSANVMAEGGSYTLYY